MRESDSVARLGGDEFAVIQCRARGRDGAGLLADRLIEAVSAPYTLKGQCARIGTSVGITLAPQDGLDLETLLKNSDAALYRAKDAGRGCFRFFDPDSAAGLGPGSGRIATV